MRCWTLLLSGVGVSVPLFSSFERTALTVLLLALAVSGVVLAIYIAFAIGVNLLRSRGQHGTR